MEKYVCTLKSYDVVKVCKYCDSRNIRKRGIRRNKSGDVQLMECMKCGKRFSVNFGFRYRRFDSEVISETLHLYYSGMSGPAIVSFLETKGMDIDDSTVYRWVARYGQAADKKMNSIIQQSVTHGGQMRYTQRSRVNKTICLPQWMIRPDTGYPAI